MAGRRSRKLPGGSRIHDAGMLRFKHKESEKCEMSEPTKVQMAVLVLVSPVMGVAALATYWAHRDC